MAISIKAFARMHPSFSHATINASSRPLETDCCIPRFFCPRLLSSSRSYSQFNFLCFFFFSPQKISVIKMHSHGIDELFIDTHFSLFFSKNYIIFSLSILIISLNISKIKLLKHIIVMYTRSLIVIPRM